MHKAQNFWLNYYSQQSNYGRLSFSRLIAFRQVHSFIRLQIIYEKLRHKFGVTEGKKIGIKLNPAGEK